MVCPSQAVVITHIPHTSCFMTNTSVSPCCLQPVLVIFIAPSSQIPADQHVHESADTDASPLMCFRRF